MPQLLFHSPFVAVYAQCQRHYALCKTALTGLGNGSSWVNASNNPKAMIYASIAGDEVCTQAPFGSSSPAGPRDKTFYVKDGVKNPSFWGKMPVLFALMPPNCAAAVQMQQLIICR